MDNKNGGLYKNVNIPVKVLNIFIICGVLLLAAVTIIFAYMS